MFCVTLEYGKETVNSILDVAMQAAHVLIRSTCKSKKTAFKLGHITKLIVLCQAERADDFYTTSSV